MARHNDPHPLAGQSVTIPEALNTNPPIPAGAEFRLEDWWDRLTEGSWMDARGNPAAMIYAIRSGFKRLPVDDEVVYGKVGALGHLVHVSELGARWEGKP